MEISDIVGGFESGAPVDVSLEKEEVESNGWDFYVVVASGEKRGRHAVLRAAPKLKISEGVGNSSNYISLLEIGDFLFSEKGSYSFVQDLDTADQFKLLMQYLGIKNEAGHRTRSGHMISIYRQVSELVAGLAGKGCNVTVAGNAESAGKVAGLYEMLTKRS